MTDALTAAIETATTAVADIDDPVARFHAARRVRTFLADGDRVLREIERAIASGLYNEREDRTWAEVGEQLGVSGSRAEAIAKRRAKNR